MRAAGTVGFKDSRMKKEGAGARGIPVRPARRRVWDELPLAAVAAV